MLDFTLSWFLNEIQTPTSKFYHRGNPNQIGFRGYSAGGSTFFSWIPTNPLIKAAFLGQPSGGILPLTALSAITIPIFMTAGSDNTPDSGFPNLDAAGEFPRYNALGTPPCKKWMVEIQGERHLTPTNPCHDIQFFFNPIIALTTGLTPVTPNLTAVAFRNLWNNNGCTYFNPIKPLTTQQSTDIIGLYSVAFFKVFVEGDCSYKKFLDVDYAVKKQLPIAYYHNKTIVTPFVDSAICVPTTVPTPQGSLPDATCCNNSAIALQASPNPATVGSTITFTATSITGFTPPITYTLIPPAYTGRANTVQANNNVFSIVAASGDVGTGAWIVRITNGSCLVGTAAVNLTVNP